MKAPTFEELRLPAGETIDCGDIVPVRYEGEDGLPLETRDDAHVPTGPEDVRVTVASEWDERPTEDGDGVVRTLVRPGYVERRTTRTRWLAFLNANGKLVYAPALRTQLLALMLNMGQAWFEDAMRLPEVTLTLGAGELLPGDTPTVALSYLPERAP